MAARTITVTLPNGQIASRATEKSYTHVVAARSLAKDWIAYAWASTEATAKKRAKDAAREEYFETQILTIDGQFGRSHEQLAAYAADSSQAAERSPQLVNVAPIVSLRIVRDAEIAVPAQVKSPADLYAVLRERFADADREQFIVICLDTKNRVLAINVAFIGSLNSAMITLREVFKAACIVGAAAIAVAHNHPTGDPTPSPEDVLLTRQIVDAGHLLDINMLDHIVLGNGRWVSLRERGLGFSR